MDYQDFKKIIETYKNGMDMISELYDLGFDLIEGRFKLSEIIDKQFHNALELVYDENGIDWINWFIFESDYGTKDYSKIPTYTTNDKGIKLLDESKSDGYGAHDVNGNPICYSIESLWEYIEKNYRL